MNAARDPIAVQAGSTWGASRVDVRQGESTAEGQVFHVAGWFDWSDQRRVRFLRDLAERYGRDPDMRWYTANVLRTSGAPSRDTAAQAAALLRFVQTHVYYTNEPGEQIQSPWRTLAVRNGDCDDMALLLAAMLESVAIPWRFALAGKARTGKPARWVEGQRWPFGLDVTHIYVFVDLGNGQLAAAEPTIAGLPFGHDVVTDGLPPHLRTGAGARDLRGYAAPITQDATPAGLTPIGAAGPAAPSLLAQIRAAISLPDLAAAVVQGVAVSAAVAYMVERRKRR